MYSFKVVGDLNLGADKHVSHFRDGRVFATSAHKGIVDVSYVYIIVVIVMSL